VSCEHVGTVRAPAPSVRKCATGGARTEGRSLGVSHSYSSTSAVRRTRTRGHDRPGKIDPRCGGCVNVCARRMDVCMRARARPSPSPQQPAPSPTPRPGGRPRGAAGNGGRIRRVPAPCAAPCNAQPRAPRHFQRSRVCPSVTLVRREPRRPAQLARLDATARRPRNQSQGRPVIVSGWRGSFL
jgi:hypothetical protein